MAKSKQKTISTHPNHIGIKEGMGYMYGEAANLFVLTYVSSFLKVFYTDVLKISGTQIALLFLLTRLWDAINDPLWGMLVAKRKPNKNGKFRPYLRWVSFPLALSCVLCFLNFRQIVNNDTFVLAMAYISYIIFGMLYTGMNVPFGSLASVITDEPAGRTLLSTFRAIGGGIGGGVILLIAPLFIYTKSVSNGEEIKVADGNKMLIFGIIISVLTVVFYQLCFKTTKERVMSEPEPHVDVKKTYGGMFKSLPFVSVALAGILISGQLQFASFNQYLYKNYFVDTNLSIIGTIAQYLPMAVMILFTPKLVERFGKKEICVVGSGIAAAASIALAVVRPERNQAWLFMVFLFAVGFGYSVVSITNWAVVSDVIDFQFFKTGIRSESAIYAVYTFSRKLGQTAADSGGMVLLEKWVGYNGEKMANAGFVAGVSPRLMTICTVIPAVVYTLVFLLMIIYPLNKKKLEPVYKYNREAVEKANAEFGEKSGEQ